MFAYQHCDVTNNNCDVTTTPNAVESNSRSTISTSYSDDAIMTSSCSDDDVDKQVMTSQSNHVTSAQDQVYVFENYAETVVFNKKINFMNYYYLLKYFQTFCFTF